MAEHQPTHRTEAKQWLAEAERWATNPPPQGITSGKADLIITRLIQALHDAAYWREQAEQDSD